MCGIVGYVRAGMPVLKNAKEIMSDLLFIDTLRGRCGTGIGALNLDGSGEIHKKSLPGPDFLNSAPWERAAASMQGYRVCIGHNRAGTVGQAKDRNAHPFGISGKYGEIILVHNGTLTDYYKLGPLGFNHEVDSAYAAAAIAEVGPEEALKKIQGWYVFVWIDVGRKTFNVARNQNRDFAWTFDTDGNMFFASEWEMLDFVLDRHGVDLKRNDKGRPVYSIMNEHHWCSWDLSGKPPFDLTKYTQRKIEKEEPVWNPRKKKWEEDYDSDRWGDEMGVVVPLEGRKPTSEGEKELVNRGFKLDEYKRAQIRSWHPYDKNASNGRAEGWLVGHPHLGVVINAISLRDWEDLIKPLLHNVPVRLRTVVGKGADARIIAALDYPTIRTVLSAARLEHLPATVVQEAQSPPKEPKEPAKELDEALDMVKMADGPYVSFNVFKEMTKQGCANCSDPADRIFADQYIWNHGSPQEYLCQNCQKDPQALALFGALAGARNTA